MAALVILGASGHGKVVAEAATLARKWSEIVFFDDAWPCLRVNGRWPVVGDTTALLADFPTGAGAVVAIGDNRIRLAKSELLRAKGVDLVNIVHPAATVSDSVILAGGCVVLAGAVINIDSCLGLACIVNTGATVDHDGVLGAGVHVSPGAHLAGGVKVGAESWVGIGAVVRELVVIGNRAVIAAGAVVIDGVPDDVTVGGVPARIINAVRESNEKI